MNRAFVIILVSFFAAALAGALYFGGFFPADSGGLKPSTPASATGNSATRTSGLEPGVAPVARGGDRPLPADTTRLPRVEPETTQASQTVSTVSETPLPVNGPDPLALAAAPGAGQNATLSGYPAPSGEPVSGGDGAEPEPARHNATEPDALGDVLASLANNADSTESATEGPDAPPAPNAPAGRSSDPDAQGTQGAQGAPKAGSGGILADGPQTARQGLTEEHASDQTVIEIATAEQVEGQPGLVRGRSSTGPPVGGPRATAPPVRGDSVISRAFIDDLAQSLIEGFWPQGSHPSARDHGVVTTNLKWLNTRYGAEMRGLEPPGGRTPEGRQRLLHYLFMPSMVEGLLGVYQEPLIQAMNARAESPGPDRAAFSAHDKAEMYRIYSGLSGAVAGVVRAYYATPAMERRVNAYLELEQQCHEAGTAFRDARFASGGRPVDEAVSQRYQRLVTQREQAKTQVAAALRRGADTRGLGTEALVYVASWLARRSPDQSAGLQSAGQALSTLSRRFASESEVFAGLRQGAAR